MASYGSFLQGINTPKPPKPVGTRGIPKKPRPVHPPVLPGRLKPLPTVIKPPGTPPAPPAPGMDFNNWYKTDPRWQAQSPFFDASRAQTYGEYGRYPVLGVDGKPMLGANGKPIYRDASASEAPFGIVNQLAQALAGKSQQIGDSANSRGLLFSGAMAQGQQNAQTGYEGQLSDVTLAFERALQGVNQNQADLVTSLYPDYLAQAPPAGPPKPPVAAAPAPAAAASTSATATEAARKARVKKAQDHLKQDKINAARKRRPPPPKKRPRTPAGKSATIGSSAGSLGGI